MADELSPSRSIRAALLGLYVNCGFVVIKLVAGILGNSYALIADAVESTTDVLGSLTVITGLRFTARPADERFPYGYGKAESLAAAILGLMLIGAAVGLATAAVREILTPHHMPAPFTLAVLAGVVLVKEGLFQRMGTIAKSTNSSAIDAEAQHQRSDAITSAAAFLGILIALWGGPGWESADDWAALVAAGVIIWNGIRLLKPAVATLMDQQSDPAILMRVAKIALAVPGVCAVEKIRVRRFGTHFHVDLHVQTDGMITLTAAHDLGGCVKATLREQVPELNEVLIHMEPFIRQPQESL